MSDAVQEALRYEYRGTPLWVIAALAGDPWFRRLPSRGLWWDPFAGHGEIPGALAALGLRPHWTLNEIRQDCYRSLHRLSLELAGPGERRRTATEIRIGDVFAQDLGVPAEVVIMNPPFSRALEAVEHVWRLAPIAHVVMLQRATWVDQARSAWLTQHQPDTLDLPRRVRFIQPDTGKPSKGTDSCGHAWYCWPADGRNRSEGVRRMLSQPAGQP